MPSDKATIGDVDPLSGREYCPCCSSGPRQAQDGVECPDCGYRWAGPPLLTIIPNDPIVGHKTFSSEDGGFRHEPLYASEAAALLAASDAAKAQRAQNMPDDAAALAVMFDAWQRLKELGWNDAIYCPKDGTRFDAIEAGSTGSHRCYYEGTWPNGHWWIEGDNDLWPSRPILFRKRAEDVE